MKTVADLIAAIEARYPGVPGLWAPVCQTGDRYVTLGDQVAVVPRDAPPGTFARGSHSLFDSPADAFADAAIWFDAYAGWWRAWHPGAKPTLYWRFERKMVLVETSHRRHRRYSVRCRLVLSDKPVIYADRAAACRAIEVAA